MSTSYEQTFFDALKKILTEEMVKKTDYVASGAAESYDDYRERVGELNMLKFVLSEFERTLKAFDPY